MSQDYFDARINKVGEKANLYHEIYALNRITSEEIESWTDLLDEY